MAENFAFVLFGTKISNHNGDTPILLIDHDTASIASLTPMLKQHSYKGKNLITCFNFSFIYFYVYCNFYYLLIFPS